MATRKVNEAFPHVWLLPVVFPVVTKVFFFPAHSGAVRGVAVDGLNQLTFTSGSDWLLKFWCFKTKKQEEQLKLNAAPAKMKLHRER